MITLPELAEKLKQVEETELLEVLEISSEDLVERFMDKIEDNFERLQFDLLDMEENWDE